MIPNIFHFIFGLDDKFGGKPFCLVHHLAVKSAIKVNIPQKVFLYYNFEPKGFWWEQTKKIVTTEEIDLPDEIFGNTLYHYAHKSDVLRMRILLERGGIYMDLDTICIRPFTRLRKYDFVIGQQGNPNCIQGLCNAVMMSKKKSAFLELWYEEYKTFRSQGIDVYWDEHSVKIPLKLSKNKEHKKHIHIESLYSFHYPDYSEEGLTAMFEKDCEFNRAYCHHLWESLSYDKYFESINLEFIRNSKSTYAKIARNFIQ